jgi:chorismate-pyruvate lyase
MSPFALAAAAQPAAAWPDTVVGRLEVLALLQTFNAALLSHDSATQTLELWCADHHLAPDPHIVARLDRSLFLPADPVQRQRLAVSDSEPLGYRHVQLLCGEHVLSEADNWYVPSRLSPDMNRALEGTDRPFGRVVQALNYRRHTIEASLLWSPLPDGWEEAGLPANGDGKPLPIPEQLIRHRALLALPDGTPISEVLETYTRNVLAFEPPARR